MVRAQILAAIEVERDALRRALDDVDEGSFDLPTRCESWAVRDLLAHVLGACDRLPSMLAGPAPERAEVSAHGYFRADERFSDAENEARVNRARQDAMRFPTGASLVHAVADAVTGMVATAAAEPADRLVVTRWGDAMTLDDFLMTRVLDFSVHGLDFARALGVEPWITPEATAVVEALILDDAPHPGWEPVAFVEKLTGREPLSASDQAELADAGIVPPAMG